MSIYVGKDVQVTLQIPVEREPHKIPDAEPYTITLLNTPISDRDLDGVADETAHVTVVDKDGNTITPVSVDDSEGQITFAAADAGKTVFVTYRFDSAPYIAQELTLEPKQRIEGLDGLGSDVIQVWAVLQKEIDGSIKEAFKHGGLEQLARTSLPHVFIESFEDAERWDPQVGSWSITENKEYHGVNTAYSVIKNWKVKNFYARAKVYVTGTGDSYYGIVFRWLDSNNRYLYAIRPGSDVAALLKKKSGSVSTIASYSVTINLNTWYTLEVLAINDDFYCLLDGDLIIEASDDALPDPGQVGLGITDAYASANFDDVYVSSPPLRSGECGVIITYDQAGESVKIGLDGVIFSEGSIPSPKNEPVYIVTPFKARSIKLIT